MTKRNTQSLSGSRERRTQRERRKKLRSQIRFEQLEPRVLMAADLRSLDGTGNNLVHPQWGSAETAFLRTAPAAYSNGMSTPGGAGLISARAVSNRVAGQGDQDLINDRNMSAFVYAWGQFLDHDIDLTETGSPTQSFPIRIPKGDTYFDPNSTGTKTMPLSRSEFDPATGTSVSNPRQQVNSISAFVDASQVYGTTKERADALRTFVGGKLKSSQGNLLPYNTQGLENATMPGIPAESFFLAGDIRANENVELTAMQTMFMREHNRLADKFARQHPTWSDEQLYQEARRWVSAEMQVITYNEFLPAILGPQGLAPYRGYNPQVNPGISNEFATAAFRFGHSMLGTDIEFLDNQGNEVHDAIGLKESFFAPQIIEQNGIDEVMKYLASDRAQEIDTKIVDDLRNFLFGPPGSGGMDLAALNIQRGRDHGLASYNSTRMAYGMRSVASFAEITTDIALQRALQSAYGTVDKVELWVGGLAEDHMPGASIGPLFGRIIANQFQRLRDGDRFWYESEFQGQELAEIRATSLASVIRNNTTTQNLQRNVFEFRAEIVGRVIADTNSNGILEHLEQGMPGIVVQLQDMSGQVLQTTQTDRMGQYRFEQLDLGAYRVRIVVPQALRMTTRPPQDIVISRGMVADRIDFGLTPKARPPQMTLPPHHGGPHPLDFAGPNSRRGHFG